MRLIPFFPRVFVQGQNGLTRLRHNAISLSLIAFCCSIALFAVQPASAGTYYYLAPASQGGNDANNGLTSTKPWLTPNHTLNCGDVVLAEPSTAYNASSFDSGKWGTVNCPAGNNVAWLQCETFDACKVYSTAQGIYVDRSYWGVQGWEVTVENGAPGFCFGAAPRYSSPAEVHHIIFANNVANGCQAGGIVTFNMGKSASVDYIAILGNIVYNAAQGSSACFTGISVYQPIQSDSLGGTHIYVAGNFAYGTYQPDPCAGGRPYGGDGIIFDTFDGSDAKLPYPYAAQTVAENNLVFSNGGAGLEVQNNIAGSQHAPITVRKNTAWGNEMNSNQQSNGLCSEMRINSAYDVNAYYNVAATTGTTACANNPLYAFRVFTGNGTDWVWGNFLFGYNGQVTSFYNAPSFGFATNNVVGQSPNFNNAQTPSAPYCSGTGNTTSCMASVIWNLAPTNSAAKTLGYQWPSSTSTYDPMFPQWVCNVNLPSGIITKGC